MNEIVRIFMERDGMSLQGAKNRVNEMKKAINDGEDPEEVLYEEGLEVDYFIDLIEF